tara:strand:+ start:187 stop:528 length:342 start_codon:yes stop_codon:yes gene_type:complete
MKRVKKPWGWYEVLQEGKYYKVKLLSVKKGHKISLQKHEKRSEVWTVIEGTSRVSIGPNQIWYDIEPGGTIRIEEGKEHRLEALNKNILVLELQQGTCEEDDIQRIEDDYGRS